jgi:hypothetical protein
MNRDLVKAFTAGAAIASYTLVKFGADDDSVITAAAVGDSIIGAVQLVAPPGSSAATGDRVDVMVCGIADVTLGGTVTRGGLLTSNASGQATAAAPAAGVNNRTIGVALASGVSGDIIPVLLSPGSVQG